MQPASAAASIQTSPPPGGWFAAPMDDPYEVAISGNSKTGKRIQGRFSFRDQQSVDDLISILQAMKPQVPKAVTASSMPLDPGVDEEGDEAERQWREGRA